MDSPNNTQEMEVYQIPSEMTTSIMFTNYNRQIQLYNRGQRLVSCFDASFSNEPKFSEPTVLFSKHITTITRGIVLDSNLLENEEISIKPIYRESFKVNIVVKSVSRFSPKVYLD